MSYEKHPSSSGDALKKLIRSYGAPLGMILFIVPAALYLFPGRGPAGLKDFPRNSSDFMQAAKAERRLRELAGVLAAEPEDMRALGEAGRLKFQLGPSRYIEAIADLEKARSLGLADPRSFYYLGVMYQAVGLYEFAAQEYRRFLNNFPGDAETRMLLGKLCFASGDFPGAVREFEVLAGSGADDPVLLENLVLARWKNGQDFSGVLERLRQGGAAGAFLADYAEGRIKYESKDFKGAGPLLEKAVLAARDAGAFADTASLYWMAGDSAWRAGRADAACAYLGELLKFSPGHEEGKKLLAKAEKARAAAAKAASGASGKAAGTAASPKK